MNLDELQSVQSRERQASSLQHLRDSFYQDAGEYVQELHDRRDAAAAEADDPFGSEEVRRLSDDIATAERTIEAVYERRVGKIVKMASIAAADMPYDDDGLTEEESSLFDRLVSSIEENREYVLSVLDGDAPGLSCTVDDTDTEAAPEDAGRPEPSPSAGPPPVEETDSPDGFAIGDAMGGETPADSEASRPDPPEEPPEAAAGATDESAPSAVDDDSGSEPESEPDTESRVPRTTVRITADVGDIFGVDGRAYDLASEDVVTLPEENATVLTDRGQAERLD